MPPHRIPTGDLVREELHSAAMDELRLVDLFERMRQHVLSRWPGAEDALRAFAAGAEDSTTAREGEALIASLLRLPQTTPPSRRRLHQICGALDQNGEDLAALGLSPSQIRRARQGLDELRALQREHSTARSWAESFDGPAALLGALRRALPALKGQDRWRFLRAVGAPVVVPERKRIALLTRLGLLRPPEEEGETWSEHHDICLTMASLVSEPLAAVDLVLGAFSGGEPGTAEQIAVCTRIPQCERCPVKTLCDFFRHRPEELPQEPRPTLKHLPAADRPREKLAERGPEALTDAELLAAILRSGTGGGVTAIDLAQRMLNHFGSLADLARAGFGELCEIRGVGPAKAAEIMAAVEIGRRATGEPLGRGMAWDSSEAIHRAMAPRMAALEHEEFRLLLLDTRLRLIREVTVSRGDLTGATVHPREVFKQAIRESAAAVIAVHNHPSGDPSPSFEDRQITDQLVSAGEIVGIRLLDHLIIGAEGYVSFADRGWI